MKKRCCFILFLILNGTGLFAQYGKVLVNNKSKSDIQDIAVQIKWFGAEIDYKSEYNVYRQELNSGQWIKVNDATIKKQDFIADDLKSEDEDLAVMEAIVNDYEAKGDDIPGFIKINVYIEAFISTDFARFLGLYFEDHSVLRDRDYQYKIMKLVNGEEILYGTSKVITAGIYTPTESVKITKVKQKKSKVLLSWEVDQEMFYAVNIYRRELGGSDAPLKLNDKPLVVNSLTAESENSEFMYEDKGLIGNTNYQYTIRALNYFNYELLPSEPYNIIFTNFTPPLPPFGLKVKADTLKVTLDWQNQIDVSSENASVKSLIYRRKGANGEWQKRGQTLPIAVTYTDRVSEPGFYYYRVGAINAQGIESYSETVLKEVEDVIAPSAPRGLSITSDTGEIVLRWSANPELDVWGYGVYRTINNNDADYYVLMNSQPITTTSFTQKIPRNVKNKFLYKLVAIDSSLNKSDFSVFVEGQMPDVTPPDMPQIKNIKVLDNRFEVVWHANIDPDLMKYRLFRFEERNIEQATEVQNAIPSTVTAYTDTNVKANVAYRYYLIAEDSTGNKSQRSDIFDAFLYKKENDLDAPKLTGKLNKRKGEVALFWSKLSHPSLGYIVYRGINEETPKAITGIMKDNQYQDRSLSGKTTYHYHVKVFGEDGKKTSSNTLTYSID